MNSSQLFGFFKKPVFLVFTLLGLIISAPVFAQISEVPEDFEIIFVSSPSVAADELDLERLVLNSGGQVHLSPKISYSGQFPNYTRQELPEITLQLNPQAMAEILAAIRENEFFSLSENYNDPNIIDGDWAELTITLDGQTHKVRTRNIKVNAFDRITVTINAQLSEERQLKYNAINGADYEEVER